MTLYMLPTAPASEPSGIGTLLGSFIHDGLPTFALWAGLMAVIWIACAAIAFAGAFTGTVLVTAIRAMARSCADYLRRRGDVGEDHVVNADAADEGQATIIDLDRHRQSRDPHLDDARPDDRFRDDDPS